MKTRQTAPDTKKTAGPPPRRVRPQIIAGGLSPEEVDALIVPDQVRRAPPKVAKLPPATDYWGALGRADDVALGQIAREASAQLPQDDRFAWAFEG